MSVPLDLAWYTVAEGVDPTAARQPWDPIGVQALSVGPRELQMQSGDANQTALRRNVGSGRLSGSVMVSDRIEIQASVRVGSTAGHTAVLAIGDGQRTAYLYIGDALAIVGTTTVVIRAAHDKTRPHVYGFVKRGSSGFDVIVDGRTLYTLPYTRALPDTARAAVYAGNGAAMSGGSTYWRFIEAAANLALPQDWLVQRTLASTDVAVQRRLSEGVGRELVRSLHGAVSQSAALMRDVTDQRTSGRINLEVYAGSGAAMPGTDNNLGEIGTPGDLTIVRERFSIAATILAPCGVTGSWGAALPGGEEIRVGATITVREILRLTHPIGMVGPLVVVREGWRYAAALIYDATDGTYGWQLVDPGNETIVGDFRWIVDPFQAHRVELYVWRGHRVMLVVDGNPIDTQPVSAFEVVGNVSGTHRGEVSRNADADRECAMDLEDVEIRLSAHDLQRRPALLSRVAERMIPFGGCERNDELEAWVRLRHGVHRMRGTTIGVVHELRRISCGVVRVFNDPLPLSWYLNVSFPPPWPVYLNVNATRRAVQLGISDLASTMTATEIARWAAFHLLPRSTSEATFEVGVVKSMAGFVSTPTDSTSTYTATGNGAKFHLNVRPGDTVHVRKASGAGRLTRTVTASTSGSITVAPALPGGYGAGATVYKTLARS